MKGNDMDKHYITVEVEAETEREAFEVVDRLVSAGLVGQAVSIVPGYQLDSGWILDEVDSGLGLVTDEEGEAINALPLSDVRDALEDELDHSRGLMETSWDLRNRVIYRLRDQVLDAGLVSEVDDPMRERGDTE